MSAKKAQRKSGNALKVAIWAIVGVVIVVLFLVLVKAVSGGGNSTATTGSSPAPAALVKQVTTLPASLFATVGQGSVTTFPKKVQAPALTSNGKPLIVYIGAEYCPYCAAERWPMVIALSRFGSWQNLQLTHSSTTDVYANTRTFSFHGATFSGDNLALNTVEMQSNVAGGDGGYTTLETPTATETALLNTYDVPPYTSSQGGIPFIDFGGQYISSGASYNPGVLAGKTQQQIADALSDPTSQISQSVIGAANVLTAVMCSLTDNQPGNVCSTSTIQMLQAKINAA